MELLNVIEAILYTLTVTATIFVIVSGMRKDLRIEEKDEEIRVLRKRLQAAEDANYKTTFRMMLNEVSKDA